MGEPRHKNIVLDVRASEYIVRVTQRMDNNEEVNYRHTFDDYERRFELDKELTWNEQLKELLDEN